MINYSVSIDEKTQIAFITLTNGDLSATFLNFGARWHTFLAPDKNQCIENILLSLDTPEEILADKAQFGALVGPVAGRIKNAKWKDFSLEKNDGNNHIHGGNKGWSNQFWDYRIEENQHTIKVVFSLTDTKSGYPGPIHVINSYELTTTSVILTTEITTKENTLVNPTNHAYFNLSGNTKDTIKNHSLTINSNKRLELDQTHMPTGIVLDLENTSYDFKQEKTLNSALSELKNGLNDVYLLKQTTEPQVILGEPISGRKLNIYSNRGSVIVFSATGFDDNFNVSGQHMTSELGLALETQELPDIIHHPKWGNIELLSGKTKKYQTIYEIGLI